MRTLVPLLTAWMVCAVAMCAADPTVVWYRFEDGKVGETVPGNTRVKDSGPNALDGWTPYGCHAQRVPGIAPGSKGAWDISGLADWFLVPDNPRLAREGSLTLEAWVKIRAYQPTAVSNFIVFRGDASPGRDAYFLALKPSEDLVFRIEGPGFRQGDAQPAVECRFVWFGVPIHVAGVFDAARGSLGLYVNGRLMASGSTHVRPRVNLNPAMAPGLGVGGYDGGDGASFALNGVIDEVRVSSTALQPSAFLCGPRDTLKWVGTRGFEQDGVEPDRGGPETPFLFAVRCLTHVETSCQIRLELRRGEERSKLVPMSRARGLPGDEAQVYRARVELDRGTWEYRMVGDRADGLPTQWHSGPMVE